MCVLEDGSICRKKAASREVISFPESSQISIDVSGIDLRRFCTVFITVTVLKGVRAQQASVQLEVIDDESLPVQMEALHSSATRVWVSASLNLDAAATGAHWEDTRFSWELSWVGRGPEVQGVTTELLPAEAVPTGWSSQSLMLELAASRHAAVLGPGSAFTLRLRAQRGQRTGEAMLRFNVGRGPSAGACASAPTSAQAFMEEVTTVCTEWAASDLPLQFRFGTADGAWTPWSYLNWYSGMYPAGVHLLRAELRDASGASTLSNATVIHVHESKTSVLGGEREGRFAALQTTVGSLRRLKRMPTLLHLSMHFMSTLSEIGESQGKEALAHIPTSSELVGRRQLASFLEYRTRVRNLLLRACAGAALEQTSQLSSTAVLEAGTILASQPEEVFDELELASLVDAASVHVLADELRVGILEKGYQAVDKVIIVSEHLNQVKHGVVRILHSMPISWESQC